MRSLAEFRERHKPQPLLWEANSDARTAAIQEFFEIKNVRGAKREILNVSKDRYKQARKKGELTRNEARNRLRYISNAINFAEDKHTGQERMSGDPYILHPLMVAYMNAVSPDTELNDLHGAIALGASHDVLEDTLTHPDELSMVIGDQETAHAIALSYKLRYFDETPSINLDDELDRIKQTELNKMRNYALITWSEIDRTDDHAMHHAHSEWIKKLPAYVGNTKAHDTTHNLDTLPNPEDHDENMQRKIKKMWNNKLTRTLVYILPLATGAAAELLREAYKRAQEKKGAK